MSVRFGFCLGSALLFVGPTVFADTSGWWGALEGGRSISIDTAHTTVVPMPEADWPDNYIANTRQNSGIMGASFGYQFPLFPQSSNRWFPAYRVGLAFDSYANQDISGYIQKYQDVIAYTYQYTVSSKSLWLENQLDIIHIGAFTPFVELGLGASRNKSSNYQEAPTPNNDLPRALSAGFVGRNNTAFAYRAGVGIGVTFPTTHPINLSIAYRYTNRGEVYSGYSTNYPTIGEIDNDLTSSDVLLALRYNF